MSDRGLAIIVLILFFVTLGVGAVIGDGIRAKHEMEREKALPECNYSVTLQIEGFHHMGYWIGESGPGEKACIVRFDKPGTIVDEGL